MGQKKHKNNVKLSKEERSKLGRLTVAGTIGVRKLNRVKILLLADENHVNGQKTGKEIAEKVAVGLATVERTCRRYAEEGLDGALTEKARSGRPSAISGVAKAQITALACSDAPEGFGRWSLRLLAGKAVELDFVESISHDAVRKILKKTRCGHT